MNGSRTQILARVRDALKTPDDPHVRHGDTAEAALMRSPDAAVRADAMRSWLPAVGPSHEDRKAVFAECSAKLKTRFEVVAGLAGAHEIIRAIAKEEGWKSVASHHSRLTNAACAALGLREVFADPGYDKHELAKCEGGITGCLALVAQTGSVLVTPDSAGGRALSVIPPHHIVLATKAQLIGDLPEAWAMMQAKYGAQNGDRLPSFASLITGPSRTGDIERILILGAHGPKKLTVVLLEA